MNAYHEQITELFDEYYRDKTTVKRRIAQADALIEEFIDKHGKRPPASVCSRLATYILLDTLTDSHPDKMTREEYPIMSYGQTGRHFEKHVLMDEIEYDEELVRGYVKSSGLYGRKLKNAILDKESKELALLDWDIILGDILSDREAIIVKELFIHNSTQAEVAKELRISQPRVAVIATNSLDKLRDYLINN